MEEDALLMDNATVVARIAIAALLGGVLGLERQLRDQPAGFRTHILVALGACLFTLSSGFGFGTAPAGVLGDGVRVDLTRIASQVVVGIGFLGGGAILRHGATVRGLTTAANLWVAASVGLAVGMGFYVGATVTAGLAVLCLAGLKPLEKRLSKTAHQDDHPSYRDLPHPP